MHNYVFKYIKVQNMDKQKKNRKKLRALMALHDIKGPDVAEIMGRKPGTVNVWMSEKGSDITDEALFYLEHLLKTQNTKTA